MSDTNDTDMGEPRGTKRTAEEAGLPPGAPRRIKALDQDVVNKIAAGEIIVAPMNALKEMMENSIDAGSTAIEVLVKEGGLKLLQITDNGHGIQKEDLPILCERFTTSKLKEFEDLMSIGTYGFRGEALASISHIAHLKVTTKTAGSSCAWQAHYADGKLTPPKPGQSAEPRPCAGRPGTQITVEDLFYNVPHRRRAFRSPSEEYARILDIVSRYAVHCESVAFTIKKHGESGAGFSVSAAASKVDRIRQAHGTAVAKELLEFETEDQRWGFRASGYCSNSNHSFKRTTILLFINNRAVESSTFKKSIEQIYQMFLPKGGHPFVYLSLDIDPGRVDVNVHPTKREVHFLNEDEIIDLVCKDIRERLMKVDTSRTFKTQTLLPTVTPMTSTNPSHGVRDDQQSTSENFTARTPAAKKPYENNLVRTDSKMRKITSMLPPALTSTASIDDPADSNPTTQSFHNSGIQYATTDREPVSIRLTSIKNLRAQVRDNIDTTLTETLASLTWVGLVDDRRRLCAIQCGVKLYLIDYGMLSNEFFYQVGLTDFGNFGSIELNPPPPLRSLLDIAAATEIELDPTSAGLDHTTIVEKVHEQLMSRKSMLREYFNLDIDDDGNLLTIPMLIKGYLPAMAKLPTFLLRLGPFVDWTAEEGCFRTFLTELASFYVPERLPRETKAKESDVDRHMTDSSMDDNDNDDDDDDATLVRGDETSPSITVDDANEYETILQSRRRDIAHALEHVLFPAFRARLVATKPMTRGMVEVADLKGLYRVFERC